MFLYWRNQRCQLPGNCRILGSMHGFWFLLNLRQISCCRVARKDWLSVFQEVLKKLLFLNNCIHIATVEWRTAETNLTWTSFWFPPPLFLPPSFYGPPFLFLPCTMHTPLFFLSLTSVSSLPSSLPPSLPPSPSVRPSFLSPPSPFVCHPFVHPSIHPTICILYTSYGWQMLAIMDKAFAMWTYAVLTICFIFLICLFLTVVLQARSQSLHSR